jgi:predicted kinase
VAAHATPERLGATWNDILSGAAAFVGSLLAAEDLDILIDFGPRFLRTHDALLRARLQGGRVCEGHGDLHAEHVCVLAEPAVADDVPPLAAGIYVFDCIEFSRALRCTDVAAEVAFLSMDLERRGHPDLARRFVAAYAARADDHDLERLLPFYVSERACVRGKVEALKSDEQEVDLAERDAARERTRAFYRLAVRHAWQTCGPVVIACAGLSGSGKSTLAAVLADATGFALLSSDVLRKTRTGVAPAAARAVFGAGLYTPQARRAVYAALCTEAGRQLAAGRSVIVDATWIHRRDRNRLAAEARSYRRPLVFIECRANEATIRERLEARAEGQSISDARWETFLGQRGAWESFAEDEAHFSVDTGGGVPAMRAATLGALWSWTHENAVGGRRPS